MMSKEGNDVWGQELHIDDTSPPSASDWLKICASSNQNHFLDLGNDTDVEFLHSFLLQGNQRWCCESQFFLRLGLI